MQTTKLLNTIISFTFGFAFSSLIYSITRINDISTDSKIGEILKSSKSDFRGKETLNVLNSQGDELFQKTYFDTVTAASKIDETTSTNSLLSSAGDMCSALDIKSSSSSSIWTKHLKEIFYASRHDQDVKDEYIWHDFTSILLKDYMTTRRLHSSTKSLPSRYWHKVGEVLNVAWDRYKFMKQNPTNDNKMDKSNSASNEEPRKINILVLGGSVTMGVFCLNNPVQETNRFSRRNCAWPTRLGQLLNHLFGDDIVDVHMITLGGTNTESAIQIWDYALFPSDMPHPDIVIHGYSTNDMHVLSENEAKQRGVTLEDMILEVNQKFVRTILKPPSNCKDRPTPLLLYYDDYIGNEQRELLKTNSFARASQTLASYYGFGLVSYADAVKHIVYGDTGENWFSPSNWPERQVHPGMGMHISSMWIIAFNLLNIATTYCGGAGLKSREIHGSEFLPEDGLLNLRSIKKLDGRPKDVPQALPPELNSRTSLDDISSKWQSTQSSHFDASVCKPSDVPLLESCAFSWIGGLERKFDKPKHLEERMKSVLLTNKGWKASDDNGKLGLQATERDASFEMKILLDKLDVQTLNFMVMTSYGEKWEGSKIRVDVFVDRLGNNAMKNITKTMEIKGFHDRHTSETYTYKLDLNEARAVPKDALRVHITLIGGSTFKIMGMAFCDH